jgi:hypothetical protein
MPAPRPFDLGNVLATAEGIKNARYSRDPNSLANQLLAAKIGHENDLGGGLKMAPISFKDATAESIAAAMQSNDPSLLERVPYKPWTVDTKTHRIFYDINPVTRESREIDRIPIENFTAAYDTAAGGAAVKEGLPNPRANTVVSPDDLNIPVTTRSPQIPGPPPPLTDQEFDINRPPAVPPPQTQAPVSAAAKNPYTPKSEAELARDKTTATEQAKADVKEKVIHAKNLKAYNTFTVAMGNLSSALRDTMTGYFSGKVPAMGASAQIADAAQKIAFPAIKSLVREAGEGIFTDRDAADVIAMLPTRETHPDAIPAIEYQIHAYVAAKLGMPPPTPPDGMIDRPTWIAPDDARWNQLSNEQKMQIIKAGGE